MSSSLSDSSTFKVSKAVESMFSRDVDHLSETALESFALAARLVRARWLGIFVFR